MDILEPIINHYGKQPLHTYAEADHQILAETTVEQKKGIADAAFAQEPPNVAVVGALVGLITNTIEFEASARDAEEKDVNEVIERERRINKNRQLRRSILERLAEIK